MAVESFTVTISPSRFLIVDAMQLLTEINMTKARKLLKLSLMYSSWQEIEDNRICLTNCFEEIEQRMKKQPRIINRAKKLVDMYT